MIDLIKKRRAKIGAVVACVVITGLLVYLFLWGKLFPYSPVKMGFARHELLNTVVYVQNGAPSMDLKSMDSYPLAVEKSHELRFIKKPEIYFFSRQRQLFEPDHNKSPLFCLSKWELGRFAMGISRSARG